MDNSGQLEKVCNLLKLEKADEAKTLFITIEEQNTPEFYLVKGVLEQKYQNWGEAINAFNRVLEFDSENEEAKNNLHLIQNILNFWNPDMFNP